MSKLLKFTYIILFLISGLFAQSHSTTKPVQLSLDSLYQKIQELNKKVEQLQAKEAENELEKLRQAALQKAKRKTPTSGEQQRKVFVSGAQSLNALNPDISVTGDMFSNYEFEDRHENNTRQSGFHFRSLEVQLQSYLDPFSTAKAIVELGEEGVDFAEAYVTWINPLPKLNLVAGKFRQQFGIINRWHEHALDQTFFPLPIEMYMGEEGLTQTGFSIDWFPPALIASSNELILQITNSENDALFNGEVVGLPSTLISMKNFYDLSPSTYFEWGFSGIIGPNDHLGFTFKEKHRWTRLAGVNFTLSWTPVNRSLYKSLDWRNEIFYLNRDVAGGKTIEALGGYSYINYKMSRRWIAGFRIDIAQPPVLENGGKFYWQIAPVLTFWQSEFVYLRMEYNHREGHNIPGVDNRLILQIDWSLGPHKHSKY